MPGRKKKKKSRRDKKSARKASAGGHSKQLTARAAMKKQLGRHLGQPGIENDMGAYGVGSPIKVATDYHVRRNKHIVRALIAEAQQLMETRGMAGAANAVFSDQRSEVGKQAAGREAGG